MNVLTLRRVVLLAAVSLLMTGCQLLGSAVPDRAPVGASPVPMGWPIDRSTVAGFGIGYPPDWSLCSLPDMRSQLSGVVADRDDEVRSSFQWVIDQIDEGVLVGCYQGGSPIAGYTDTILAFDVPAGETLSATADAAIARAPVAAVQQVEGADRAVVTPVGPGLARTITLSPAGGAPSRQEHLFVDVGDGRVLWFLATGPQEERTLADLMRTFGSMLERR